jgi:hypothetical protein
LPHDHIYNNDWRQKPDPKSDHSGNDPKNHDHAAENYLDEADEKTDQKTLDVALAVHRDENIPYPHQKRQRSLFVRDETGQIPGSFDQADRIPPERKKHDILDDTDKNSRGAYI